MVNHGRYNKYIYKIIQVLMILLMVDIMKNNNGY